MMQCASLQILVFICVPFWWNKIPLSNWFKKNGSGVSVLMYILEVKMLAAEVIDWGKNSPEITRNM